MSLTRRRASDSTSDGAAPVEMAPADYSDPVIDAYKQHVDRTLLRENLKLTVDERFQRFEQFMQFVEELRRARPSSSG